MVLIIIEKGIKKSKFWSYVREIGIQYRLETKYPKPKK